MAAVAVASGAPFRTLAIKLRGAESMARAITMSTLVPAIAYDVQHG